MKKQIVVSMVLGLVVSLGLLTQPVTAQMMDRPMMRETSEVEVNDNHGETLPVVLEDILQAHGWEQVNQVSCDQVTDAEWEALGEAVMSQMHPDSQQHEAMDRMMGGEGSESLRQAHMRMGQNYLGCASGNVWGGSMMAGSMMGGGMSGMMGSLGRSMMTTGNKWSSFGGNAWLGWGWWHLALSSLTGGLFMALLVAATRYLWKKGGQNKRV